MTLAESVELFIAGIEALRGTFERQHGKLRSSLEAALAQQRVTESHERRCAHLEREEGKLRDDT